MILQRYNEGEIHKLGKNYSYVVAGEVEGSYPSIKQLAVAHPLHIEEKPKRRKKSKK